ncbi:MAG: 2-C-methyl-D-erythritol 4-phosphate cytidylyltransferase [Pseudomonadota bacterium]
MKTAALIVAGGRGTRMGGETPKQYLPVRGQTILSRTVSVFLDAPGIHNVQVVIGAGDRALYDAAFSKLANPALLPPVIGGESRGASVVAGLKALAEDPPDRVLIHDAARPFCPESVIAGVIAALDETDGAFAAVPVVDALWRGEGGRASDPVSRDGLYRAQTPQGFHYGKIVAAYRAADGNAADDVAIARAAGLGVAIVPGDEANFKITTPGDMTRAERHLKDETR